METFSNFFQSTDKNFHARQFDIQPHHIQFQTNDSQASDASYQSSLSSNQQGNIGNAQYFREEMSRFFINYPQLLNQQLVGSQTHEKSLWGDLANDMINQAKQQPITLQGIAKRIAFYRQKTQQIDIIDLIVKEKDLILKQLDDQAKMCVQQNITSKAEDGDKRNISMGESSNNTYFSWRKKHQTLIKNNFRKNSAKKQQSHSTNSHQSYMGANQSKDARFSSANKFNKTNRSNNNSTHFNDTTTNKFKLTKNLTVSSHFSAQKKKDQRKNNANNKNEYFKATQNLQNKLMSNNQSSQLRNILKFQPKTEVAKQLLQQIKKHHPNDQIGIKKTIVNFLYRHRQTMKKSILNKSSLSQRLSKLHIEDSKQLLLFCPLKKTSIETDMPLNNQTNKFLQILNQVSSGHLMKYWKLLQQRKL